MNSCLSQSERLASKVFSKEDFENLAPRSRGYVVYMAGCRDDQPNVPNETNPYPEGSRARLEWDKGALRACQDAQDSEE